MARRNVVQLGLKELSESGPATPIMLLLIVFVFTVVV